MLPLHRITKEKIPATLLPWQINAIANLQNYFYQDSPTTSIRLYFLNENLNFLAYRTNNMIEHTIHLDLLRLWTENTQFNPDNNPIDLTSIEIVYQ